MESLPHKSEWRVWENFQINLKKFREAKAKQNEAKQSPYQPSPTQTMYNNWKRQGYPSKLIQDQINAIADSDTPPTIRRTLIASLKTGLESIRLNNVKAEEDGSNPNTQTPPKRPKRGPSFLLYMRPPEAPAIQQGQTFIAPHAKQRYPFRLAFKLPHIEFPIGDGKTDNDRAHLTCLLDTGGCCMMGKLEYFQELHRVCPQYFAEFFTLESQQFEEINIGGLKEGIWLTHMAVIWIPYNDNGCMTLEFGLSPELPVDALMGVNFQKDAKMQINLGENKVYSAYLGDSYDLIWKAPQNQPIEHIQSEATRSPRVFINEEGFDDSDEEMDE